MSTLTIHILNFFVTLETILLLLTNSVMRKKQKLMDLSNIEQANKLVAMQKKLRTQIEEIRSFPIRATAKVVLVYNDRELALPSDLNIFTAEELATLAIGRIENKIAQIEKEAEKL